MMFLSVEKHSRVFLLVFKSKLLFSEERVARHMLEVIVAEHDKRSRK